MPGFFIVNFLTVMNSITEPTLLLNEDICKANIRRMVQKARSNGLAFKPHMKTHQSAAVGDWLRNSDIEAITVSSVKMAEYFATHGWRDITIAFPCNVRQIDRVNKLADKATVTLLINNLHAVEVLQKELENAVKAYIEIDTGSGRTGLSIQQLAKIKKLIQKLQRVSSINWIGFYSHPGHSYSARSSQEIQTVHESVTEQSRILADKLKSEFGTFEICIGDTPCCSQGTGFEGVDAISPGNFVFYDLMQVQIGSSQVSDIAVAMACPVVDTYPERLELAIHGGAIHFSKESMLIDNNESFGLAASQTENHWEIFDTKTYLKSLSQEHGIVSCSKDTFDQFQVGDLITILPVHSCLTANLMNTYQLSDDTILTQMSSNY